MEEKKTETYPVIFAVDFDGTLCENKWPEIGEPNKELIEFLRRTRETGNKVILWTNRDGEQLDQAVIWCYAFGLEFDAINDNLQSSIDFFGNNSRKVFANFYVDDKNVNPSSWNLPFKMKEPVKVDPDIQLTIKEDK